MAIILSHYFCRAYERVGRSKPITTTQKGKHSGRFIGITLQFPNFDSNGQKIRGDLKIFVASIYQYYHPYETYKYQAFNSHITAIMEKAPKKTERILGQDINPILVCVEKRKY